MTPPDSSPSTHSASKSPPRSTGRNKVAAWIAFIAIPLALAPLALAFVEHESGVMFFITFGSMCVAAPCVGFWWGERKGQSNEGRAALGCVGTLVLFAGYFIWLLVLAPLILRMMRA